MEWVADWFNGVYYENSPANNPTGPENGEHRVVRDYNGTGPGIHTTYHRFHLAPIGTAISVGFRCASSPAP